MADRNETGRTINVKEALDLSDIILGDLNATEEDTKALARKTQMLIEEAGVRVAAKGFFPKVRIFSEDDKPREAELLEVPGSEIPNEYSFTKGMADLDRIVTYIDTDGLMIDYQTTEPYEDGGRIVYVPLSFSGGPREKKRYVVDWRRTLAVWEHAFEALDGAISDAMNDPTRR